MKYLFINRICGFVSKNVFILRLQIYIDVTKKIAFLGFNDISVAECVFWAICKVVFIRRSILSIS